MLLHMLENGADDFLLGFVGKGGGFYDKGFGDFAGAVVGDLDYGAVGDGGVGEEVGF